MRTVGFILFVILFGAGFFGTFSLVAALAAGRPASPPKRPTE